MKIFSSNEFETAAIKILELHFGPCVANVGRALFANCPTTAQILRQHTKLPLKFVSTGNLIFFVTGRHPKLTLGYLEQCLPTYPISGSYLATRFVIF